MSRIIAIDYGKKRTGIAVSDTLQMIANGLTTVPTHELLAFILDYVAKEPVERILVGLPKQMNNEASENMKRIEPFVRSLKKKLPDMPVEYVDERFTSVLAHRTMLEAGLKPIYKTLEDPSCWYIGEKYFDDLYEAIGHEEGLCFGTLQMSRDIPIIL